MGLLGTGSLMRVKLGLGSPKLGLQLGKRYYANLPYFKFAWASSIILIILISRGVRPEKTVIVPRMFPFLPRAVFRPPLA